MNKTVSLLGVLLVAALPAFAVEARKSCEDLKTEIAGKLDAKGVKGYTLTVVKPEEVKDAKVVGSCDGGTMRIIYERK
jgi:hypothetical protein